MDIIKDDSTSPVEMQQVLEWVSNGHASKRKTVNKTVTSYGLKHIIEKQMGTYISNDSCIAALKQMGFTATPITGTPNFYFNIALKKQ
jgi:hypothetical protein